MALTEAEANAHVKSWEGSLGKSSYPYRAHWASRLFHHAPLENAVSIIVSGVIRSRRDPYNPLQRNIAGRGVIDTRDDAHNFVRLYFRPKTPTQFHIEGIRKSNECVEYGFQAPILVMFIFDARVILTAADTKFSAENMQKGSAICAGDSGFFSTIPFKKVYHEGDIVGDRSIIAHRCAEVLCSSPLILEHSLQWIYCRSEAEKDTLIFKISKASPSPWLNKIKVSNDIRVFNRLFAYVEHVHISPEGVTVEFHPRNDGKPIDVEVVVKDEAKNNVIYFKKDGFSAYPSNGKRWIFQGVLTPGYYEVVINLEGEEGYNAVLSLRDVVL